jgi:hypothetical protein
MRLNCQSNNAVVHCTFFCTTLTLGGLIFNEQGTGFELTVLNGTLPLGHTSLFFFLFSLFTFFLINYMLPSYCYDETFSAVACCCDTAA